MSRPMEALGGITFTAWLIAMLCLPAWLDGAIAQPVWQPDNVIAVNYDGNRIVGYLTQQDDGIYCETTHGEYWAGYHLRKPETLEACNPDTVREKWVQRLREWLADE